MSDQPLHRQVEPAGADPALAALKRKIDRLQIVYAVLFVASLVLLVYNFSVHSGDIDLLWAVTLGGAVVTRLVRQSSVSRYNQMVMGGRPAPLS